MDVEPLPERLYKLYVMKAGERPEHPTDVLIAADKLKELDAETARLAAEVERLREHGRILAVRVLQSELVLDEAETNARDYFVQIHLDWLKREAKS